MRLTPRELHRTSRPSSTAEATTIARAAELHRPHGQRIVTDDFAPLFLSTAGRAAVASMRLGAAGFRALEKTDLGAPLTFSLCRHKFIDVHLETSLDDDVEQVLILGAGYDSRAYRFATQLRGRPVHEVDLAPLSRRKAAIVADHPEAFAGTTVRRVEIDFRRESLAERLLACGFTVGARTFVVWEGVSMYLTREAVESTLSTLQDVCGRGSVLAMDFWHETPGSEPLDRARRAITRAFTLIGEPLTFSIATADVDKLLGSHGFSVIDLADADELTARYSTGDRPCERSTFVIAARKR